MKRTKKTVKTFECGFDQLFIEPPKFGKLLALNKLEWTNRKKDGKEFVWGFKDGHIVTTNCPLTGDDCGAIYTSVLGLADKVGVVGTKKFRDRVAKFLKRNSKFAQYSNKTRKYV